MTKKQLKQKHYVGIIAFVIAFIVLHFGFETIPPKIKDLEKSRSNNISVTNVQNLITEASKEIKDEDISYLSFLQRELTSENVDSTDILEKLASKWFLLGYPSISGHYAQEIALSSNTTEAWSIAGTTFFEGARKAKNNKSKEYSIKGAEEAFQNAISLENSNLPDRINLAILYAEFPPAENPMKGIQMLLDLQSKNPESTSLLFHLAKFGLQTGQVEKAIGRLEKALHLSPENVRVNCLLSDAYSQKGDLRKSEQYKKECERLKKI
jgi:tetratricopeptide (TPR) repeat protein